MNAADITFIMTVAAAILIILVRSAHPRTVSIAPTVIEWFNLKFQEWQSETVQPGKSRSLERIDLADREVADLLRSRSVEQDVLDALD